MITRSQMRRQLRAQGGIMNVAPRKKFGIGSVFQDFKDKVVDRTRKIIPNELANVAVKAAPFVAMIPGYGPAAAGIMRGLGRLDQRGNLTDAVKQGLLFYGGGKAFGAGMEKAGLRDPGASGIREFFNKDTVQRGRGLFQGSKTGTGTGTGAGTGAGTGGTEARKGLEVVKKGVDFVKEKVPFLDKIPDEVAQKLLVGGITSGASALYSYFTGAFDEPQQPGETMEEYMARRNTRVKQQMRGYMDSYYTPLRNPQYAAMSDEEKNNYIDSIVGQGMATGGRVGYQTGGISSANTLAENIARNRAAQSAFQQSIAPAQQRIRQKINRSDGLGDYVGSADLSGGTKNINSNLNAIKAAATVPFNFVKGVIGNPLNPEALTQVSLTQAQKQRLNEIAKAKGTATGNIDYSDYGSPTPTFSGIYPKTMSPLDASLATTMGGTDFRTNPDGTIEFLGGKYDFEKGSNPIYNFIDRGGIAGAVAKGVEGIGSLLTPSSAMADQPSAMPQGSPGQLNPTPTPDAGNNYSGSYQEYLDIGGSDLTESEYNQVMGKINKPTMADVAGPATEGSYYIRDLGIDGIDDASPFDILKKYLEINKDIEPYQVEKNRIGPNNFIGSGGYETFNPYSEDFDLGRDYFDRFGRIGYDNPNALNVLYNPESGELLRYVKDLPSLDPDKGPGGYQYFSGKRVSPDTTNIQSFNPVGGGFGDYGTSRMGFKNYGPMRNMASGGRVGLMGGTMPMGEPRVNQGGVTELDFRAKGGFVPVGIKEKADDVPAMLSKNEFVFTADAVRGAGNGSIENGAQKMYDTMKNLERRVT